MSPNEFPEAARQLPPAKDTVQPPISTPEDQATQLTAAQEAGVVDGDFQVSMDDESTVFESGWKVKDVLNKRGENGSSTPVVVIEKSSESPDGVSTIMRKTVPREIFDSWQQPSSHGTTVETAQGEESLQPTAAVENTPETTLETMHLIAVAEDVGAKAVEESGAVVVELPETAIPAVAESSEEAEGVVDMANIFKDGQSIENALQDPSLSPEVRFNIEAVAMQWKATHGAVKVIEQLWGEDLQPALQRLFDEASQTARSTQGLLQRTHDISASLIRLTTAREYGDVDDERRIMSQLQLDIAVPDLRRKATECNNADELMPSGRSVRVQAEVAFETVTHACRDKNITPIDFDAIAAHVLPMLQAGATLNIIDENMHDDTKNIFKQWANNVQLVEEAAAGYNMIQTDTFAGDSLMALARQLETLQYEPQHSDVYSMRVAAQHALDGLQQYQQLARRIANLSEEASQRKF